MKQQTTSKLNAATNILDFFSIPGNDGFRHKFWDWATHRYGVKSRTALLNDINLNSVEPIGGDNDKFTLYIIKHGVPESKTTRGVLKQFSNVKLHLSEINHGGERDNYEEDTFTMIFDRPSYEAFCR